jgi:peptide-methionine (S)-S-oxide reductase
MRLAAAALATAVAFQPLAVSQAGAETAIFAGGCFWCVESDMDHVPGVTETISGYSGGTKKNPTYYDHEGHREVVRVDDVRQDSEGQCELSKVDAMPLIRPSGTFSP